MPDLEATYTPLVALGGVGAIPASVDEAEAEVTAPPVSSMRIGGRLLSSQARRARPRIRPIPKRIQAMGPRAFWCSRMAVLHLPTISGIISPLYYICITRLWHIEKPAERPVT